MSDADARRGEHPDKQPLAHADAPASRTVNPPAVADENSAGPASVAPPDVRLALIHNWVTRELRLSPQRIEPASADASFRRYFRIYTATRSVIVMDAPPGREDVRPYLNVSAMLESTGVHVPRVYEFDIERGLLLLEDLGVTSYLSALKAGGDADHLYGDALAALADIQVRGRDAALTLKPYDRAALVREMALMPEWFLIRHLRLEPSREQAQIITEAFEFLVTECLAQPPVFVHRDYHSRNLMVLRRENPGIIDFQDALRGPVGYDLVSLLKDLYISWPPSRVREWVRVYRGLMAKRGSRAAGVNETEMMRWFDLAGVQRHLKVLGIFARLWHRDGKSGYLDDLPLTLRYLQDTCAHYRELHSLKRLLDEYAVQLPQANARALA
jgi:aminoglycoside/choline kinase family phosphotransferase